MSNIIHFLNVGDGDCSLIQHESGRNTLIDICNGNSKDMSKSMAMDESIYGNFKQKYHPVNPIEYLKKFNIHEIFRFILTHPDMDHMDGIKRLFTEFNIINFWDTDNNKEITPNNYFGQYKQEDWDFYCLLRAGYYEKCKILKLLDGAIGPFYNQDDYIGYGNGDGLYVLSPNYQSIEYANYTKNYNEISYVILFLIGSKKFFFQAIQRKLHGNIYYQIIATH